MFTLIILLCAFNMLVQLVYEPSLQTHNKTVLSKDAITRNTPLKLYFINLLMLSIHIFPKCLYDYVNNCIIYIGV